MFIVLCAVFQLLKVVVLLALLACMGFIRSVDQSLRLFEMAVEVSNLPFISQTGHVRESELMHSAGVFNAVQRTESRPSESLVAVPAVRVVIRAPRHIVELLLPRAVLPLGNPGSPANGGVCMLVHAKLSLKIQPL